ncbi:MAG: SAM-dependent methyltransferase [Thalassobius sp.]|nr:SAM-dependent methyltransferase [Thalassovita sp.]
MSQIETNWNPELYNNKHAFVYGYGESLIELLNPQKDERILDIGCGSGQLTQKIAELAKEAVGLDYSADMIADAKAKFPEVTFKVASAADFEFDEKFDALFSNAALHWVTSYKEAAQCMYKSLKTGGRLVLEMGGKGNVGIIVSELKNQLVIKGYPTQAAMELWYFPSVGEYASVLEEAGFRVTFAQHYDRPTELADAATGIKDWLSMFGKTFFEGVATEDIESIKEAVQQNVKSSCFVDGKWYADYKRLRIIAVKE